MEIKKQVLRVLSIGLILSVISPTYLMSRDEGQKEESTWRKRAHKVATVVAPITMVPMAVDSAMQAYSIIGKERVKSPRLFARVMNNVREMKSSFGEFRRCLIVRGRCSEQETKMALNKLQRYLKKSLEYGLKATFWAALAFLGYKMARVHYVDYKHGLLKQSLGEDDGSTVLVLIAALDNDYLIKKAIKLEYFVSEPHSADRDIRDIIKPKVIDAAAEVYYGHPPSRNEIEKFKEKFITGPL